MEFFRNIKKHKLLGFQLFFSLVFTLFFVIFMPIIPYAFLNYDFSLTLEDIGVFLMLTFFAIAETYAFYIIAKTGYGLLRDLVKEIPIVELTVTKKKITRGRKGTWCHLDFEEREGTYAYYAGTTRYKKIKRGEKFSFRVMEKARIVLPV